MTSTERSIGTSSLAALALRQHRWVIAGTTALVLGYLVYAISTGSEQARELTPAPPVGATGSSSLLVDLLPGLAALFAVFWAAPLLSREFEQRTHLLVWSQDVSRTRWFLGQTIVLLVAAAVLAAIAGLTASAVVDRIVAVRQDSYPRFLMPAFEASPVVQVGFAVFAIALGVTLSVLLRRTVLAMGGTLAVFLAVRSAVNSLIRPYYLPPERIATPLPNRDHVRNIPDTALQVDSGYLDATGAVVGDHTLCKPEVSAPLRETENCLRRRGAITEYTDVQPAERLLTFQLIETGLFLVLAVGLFFLAARALRRIQFTG
ncbi:hypothetical protein CFN78_26225 [Amycolatopsis antarctica]|uniref:ABC transporter permease n=1 Tax=Amycolatopsis antarctica TaxID=1854586 RepID=A0A263CW83_9PSEU|nr:hypothetical protein [Amycolatopsis antarctica]OZM70218.1 hypothetical protein CFN78_26225 [Amycolatopsis antarctica]